MSTMSTLRDGLQSHVESLLTTVDANYSGQVERRYRPVVNLMPSRNTVLKIMGVGGNVRYAHVLHRRRLGTPDFFDTQMAAGNLALTSHIFEVAVWREFTDADSFDGSSQGEWDALMWDPPNGLLHKLDEESDFDYSGTKIFYAPPGDSEDTEVALDDRGNVLAHYGTFTMELLSK